MADDSYDAILSELLDSAEAGRALDLEAFLARFPGQEATVRRLFATFASYRERDAALSPARPQDAQAMKPGDRLGDFEIESSLARGGMGVVYRARQLSLGRRLVALKVLPSESAGPHGVARFEREALGIASLHHPHLAEIYGFGEERGCLFFAMRLVEGPTLRDLLERRAVARASARDDAGTRRALVARIAEVADALALVHAAGVVHRDVKPSNIVVEGAAAGSLDGRAVLIDFGIARRVDAQTLTGTGASPATLSYAPPEQLLGHEVDGRADIFSLGVTLHDLLAARRPQERMQASVGLAPIAEAVPGIDPDLAAIVSKAVDPEARWRYSDAAAMRDDLRAWLRGDAVSARTPPLSQRVRRWMGRHQRRVAVGATIALAVVVAGFGAKRLADGVSVTHAAGEAFARGDIGALASAGEEAAGNEIARLRLDGEVESALERLRSGDTTDPLVDVHRCLARNDVVGALHEAATELRVHQAEADELVARYFAAQIDGRLIGAGGDIEEAWPVFAARLFYEEPIDTPEELVWSRPFHDALLDAWERPGLPPIARHYLLTAFAGCGVPSDIELLLPWALDPERSQEETRLGLRAVEFIVRRTHGCGTLGEIDAQRFWERVNPHGRRLFNYDTELRTWGLDLAMRDACRAMLIAQRARGEDPPSVASLLPDGWSTRSEGRELWRTSMQWLQLLALAEESGIAARMIDPALWSPGGGEDVRYVGLIARLIDRHEVDEATLDWLDLHGTDAQRAAYREGRDHAELLLAGKQTRDWDIDDETRLGAARLGGEWARVPESRAIPVGVTALRLLAKRKPEAWWMFLAGGVACDGMAGEVHAEACPPGSEGGGWDARHFLKLVDYGTSRVDLDFEVLPDTDGFDRALLASFQVMTREYYPRMGSAVVEIEANGWPVARVDWTYAEPRWRMFDLPSKLLRPGPNTVTIRSHATSTATLRFHGAEIRRLHTGQ